MTTGIDHLLSRGSTAHLCGGYGGEELFDGRRPASRDLRLGKGSHALVRLRPSRSGSVVSISQPGPARPGWRG